jgi:copper(I)-binding protein
MRKHLKTATIILLLASVGTMLAPITADAKTPKMVSVKTDNGKTVQLHTMKVHGQMMILVPMDMGCEVFGKHVDFC